MQEQEKKKSQKKHKIFKPKETIKKKHYKKDPRKSKFYLKHKRLQPLFDWLIKKYKFLPRIQKYSIKRVKKKHFNRPFFKYKPFITQAYAHMYIITKPNNFFFGFYSREKQERKFSFSSSFIKQKITKKKMKKNLLPNIRKFFYILKKGNYLKDFRLLLISLVLPKRLKKKTLKLMKKEFLRKFLRRKRFLLNSKSLKTFNGCTPKKQRRKKRKGFRVLK